MKNLGMTASIRLLAGLACVSSLISCNIAPVQRAGSADSARSCSPIMRRVMIDPPPLGLDERAFADAAAYAETAELADRIVGMFSDLGEESAAPFLAEGSEPVSDAMLFLSGGSQNGAYGAGYLAEWSKLRSQAGKDGLPRFRMITGISTGALQSTYAFIGDMGPVVDSYTIDSESELLDVFTPGGGLRSESTWQKLKGALSLARRGSLSDLRPLREQIAGKPGDEAGSLISDAILRRVAAEAGPDIERPRRMLLVGAVEMDSGDAYAFDLTKAAQLYAYKDQPWMRDCYIEALMASSSVPMAALPVFIDGKMYIDGGARFGVISDFTASVYNAVAEKRQAARRAQAAAKGLTLPDPLPAEKMNLYVLVNGTLEAGVTCHLQDCEKHPLPSEGSPGAGEPGAWSIDKVGLRAMSILINQSYRSSVFWATTRSKALGFTPHFTRIETPMRDHLARLEFDNPAGEVLTCSKWRERDKEKSNPLEFHPRFMQCLINYGATRAAEEKWATFD